MSEHGTDGNPRTVLLLDEMAEDEVGEHCDGLMGGPPADRRAELVVSFPEDVTDRLDFGSLSGGRQPTKRGIVTVGETMQAAGAGRPDFSEPIVEQTVADPTDLQRLGEVISQFCGVWDDAGYDIVVCFDSLTELLDANDPEVVFQFCHVLSGRLESVGAVAHFHLDPNAHSQQLQLTFEQILDETLVEEIDVEHLVPGGSSRASDADVARETETVDLDDPNEVAAANESPSESSVPAGRSGEASDDDIADALPD
ncbi:DUF7504 family protein [Haloarchaeobius salinus]|uniref:DUF7504 family protein n=1 Tax=Haloarchaeobius salinus TaxID=1198298 RepID=UPI002109E0F4|nr:hypothetical protein [Haloarchaeobius salinus]